ncbi:nuclear transport factor 2 family protein [Nocardia vulneris]|uniref:nuclear transport factor 2 family protein n=1 Tax=Nocardia vulneris TaxID=1141657 RepID=UPI0030D19815
MTDMTTAPQDRRRAAVRSDRSVADLLDAADECAVVERFYELIFLQDHAQAMALVTADVRFHAPWQLPGLPDMVVSRDELRDSLDSWGAELWHAGNLARITVRPFATPHLWFATIEGEWTARESERRYHAVFLSEVRFRDGRIAGVQQYHNALHEVIALGADVPGINVPGYGVGSYRADGTDQHDAA